MCVEVSVRDAGRTGVWRGDAAHGGQAVAGALHPQGRHRPAAGAPGAHPATPEDQQSPRRGIRRHRQ